MNASSRKLTQKKNKQSRKLLNELHKLKSCSKYHSSQIDQYSFKTPQSLSEHEDTVEEQNEDEDQVFKLEDLNVGKSYDIK